MKSIKKVFLHGVEMKDVYPHATKWKVLVYKATIIARKATYVASTAAIVYSIGYGAYFYGRNAEPVTVYAEQTVKVEVQAKAEVMDRIAKCESGGHQFDRKGAVLMKKNNNNSWDVGLYQINEATWGPTAAKMDINIFTEDGNTKFAYWLYQTRGTEPWFASKSCWSK